MINNFLNKYHKNIPITMLTCYDYWTSKILSNTNIDAMLIGDSAAMVMHGDDSTINISCDILAYHIKAVRKGSKNKFIIGDMPFLSYRKSLDNTMDSVEKLMKSGANAIKLENTDGNIDIIHHIVESGIPVMGHIGYTPQSTHAFGKNIVQGKSEAQANKLLQDAKALQDAGCFAIVFECIPQDLAKKLTDSLSIPTIGIGAGKYTSGQILVLQDMLGTNNNFTPKFLKRYANLEEIITNSVNTYCNEVENNIFPAEQHIYSDK
jgi:3-methyl-2-oxobutanoate hydroxymethyltransferase